MRDVPFLEMLDAHGKPLKDEEADDERAVKYQECSEQKEQFEKKSVTPRLFLNVSELQLRVDGVLTRPRRLDAVDVRVVTVSVPQVGPSARTRNVKRCWASRRGWSRAW